MAPGSALAVVGGGVSGITAALLLSGKYNVTLYEKNNRLGGHTNTVVIEKGVDAGLPVDTGFIVLNSKTYPLLHRLLARLGCTVRNSEMSFGYHDPNSDFYYAGTGLSGLFAKPRHLVTPSFYRFLRSIVRFGNQALHDLEHDALGDMSMKQYTRNLSPDTLGRFVRPMAAAIWSATQNNIMDFPAQTLLRFWKNHGLLSFRDRPRWQTVNGGSHSYVNSFSAAFKGRLVLGARIREIRRSASGVEIVHEQGGSEPYAGVVMATHADEALSLLQAPSPAETSLLGAWTYQSNRTFLHTDPSYMPPTRRAWASWNYTEHARPDENAPLTVTYHMNRLQGLSATHDYFVTLNPPQPPPDEYIVREILYHHPVYTRKAVATQGSLSTLQGHHRTWYCGSYFGNGFHEDAVRSSVIMAELHGESL